MLSVGIDIVCIEYIILIVCYLIIHTKTILVMHFFFVYLCHLGLSYLIIKFE